MVNIIKPFPLDYAKALSNPHTNKISPADCCKNNLSKSSCEDQNVVYDKISNSYNRTASYTIELVLFQRRKSNIGINLYTYDLKDPCTPQNGATNYVIRGITTPFSFSNNDPNDTSVKNNTQY